ncbi:lengsin-like [Apostichopus japonicus]|uniref:lengsin-like n=1 Tax=Stichopus japonicus TaxID=307972 RepID=UPI003AB70B5D
MGLEDVLNSLITHQIKTVRFQFIDLYGTVRCKNIPVRHFKEKATKGLSVLMGYLVLTPNGDFTEDTGFGSEKGYGDVTCFPEFDTFHILPWLNSVAGVLTTPLLDNKRVQACPRHIALQQLDELKKMGYSLLSAHEYEFTVLDRSTSKPILEDSNWASAQRLLEAEDFFDVMMENLPKVGIDVETVQGEHGPGQIEITYTPSFGIKAADNAIFFKNAVKEMAWKQGLTASFMSKPFKQWGSLSAHFNHSLWDQMENSILFDGGDPNKLSKIAKHWIAGILHHAKAMSILMAPTSNCMKRFHNDVVVPSSVSWGIDNRTAALRVKTNGDRGVYFENRLGAAAGNPYVSMAATIAAGIDGIRNQLPLPPEVTELKKEEMTLLPKTQEEALDCFLKDDVLCKAFGEDFIKCFVSLTKTEMKARDAALTQGTDEYEWARSYFFKYL